MGGVFLMIYLLFRLIPIRLIEIYFIPVLLFLFVYQLSIGLKQLYHFYHSDSIHLHITGSLQNSGIYSIYLAVHLPLAFYYVKKIRRVILQRLALVFISMVVLSVIYFTKSRTAIVVLAALALIHLLPVIKSNLHRYNKYIIPTFFLSLIIGGYFLFLWKPHSALGRLLISKISLLHIKEYLFTGVGYGEFYRNYPLWQIQYFQTITDKNIGEILFADESFLAYNEPLQWIVETGTMGFLAVTAILFYIFRKTFHPNEFCKTLQTTVALILISSLFSYTLHVNSIIFLFVLCIAVFSPKVFQQKINLSTRYFLPLFALNCLLITQVFYLLNDVFQWDKLSNDVLLSEKQLSEEYRKIYPSLKQSGKFMLDYSQVLFLSNDKFAYTIIERTKADFPSVATFSTEYQIAERQDDYKSMIESYKQLCGIQPYKFSFREKLMTQYIKTNDMLNAVKEAKLILSIPIKIPSQTIDSIRIRARDFLLDSNHP